jgi:uncharacterized protein (TIGR03435 family)
MQIVRTCILAMSAAAAVLAQTGTVPPRFEVASIRPTADGPPEQGKAGLHIDGAQVRFSSLSLRDYVGIAYNLKIYQISGPAWIASAKFDINAKLPDGASASEVDKMLQSLLEERFHLTCHHETKDYPVYALVIGKGGSKLVESQPDLSPETTDTVNVAASGSRDGTTVNFGKGSYMSVAGNKLEARKLQVASFADVLARFLDRPVVDQTSLKGTYDFTVDIAPEDFTAMMVRSAIAAGVNLPPQAMRALDYGSGESLFGGVEKLGLKLDPRKAPLDFLVIDRLEKTPSEN